MEKNINLSQAIKALDLGFGITRSGWKPGDFIFMLNNNTIIKRNHNSECISEYTFQTEDLFSDDYKILDMSSYEIDMLRDNILIRKSITSEKPVVKTEDAKNNSKCIMSEDNDMFKKSFLKKHKTTNSEYDLLNYLNMITQVTPRDRCEMISLGLNPLKIDHIIDFHSGKEFTEEEKRDHVNVMEKIIGDNLINRSFGNDLKSIHNRDKDIMSRNLGHSNEEDIIFKMDFTVDDPFEKNRTTY